MHRFLHRKTGWRWLLPALLLLLPVVATAQEDAAARAAAWLIAARQNEDGGYSSFGQGADLAPSDVGGTADALLALSAAGADTADPLDYLRTHPEEVALFVAADGSAAGKLALALAAAGETPRDFAGRDLGTTLANYATAAGDFGVESVYGQSLAILGLRAAGQETPQAAVAWLLERQETAGALAGSWDDGFGTAGNPDATGMALMALVAAGAGADDPAIVAAADFLERAQLASDGWEYGPGLGENANSTALALQGLRAVGREPEGAQAALLRWQGASGAFQADFGDGRVDDFFATVQATPAVAGVVYPFTAPTAIAAENAPPPATAIWVVVGGLVVLLLFGYALSRGRNDDTA